MHISLLLLAKMRRDRLHPCSSLIPLGIRKHLLSLRIGLLFIHPSIHQSIFNTLLLRHSELDALLKVSSAAPGPSLECGRTPESHGDTGRPRNGVQTPTRKAKEILEVRTHFETAVQTVNISKNALTAQI